MAQEPQEAVHKWKNEIGDFSRTFSGQTKITFDKSLTHLAVNAMIFKGKKCIFLQNSNSGKR
jgi:hypothetical protein